MDEKLFEAGIAQRKSTLGAEYVEENLARFSSTYSAPSVDLRCAIPASKSFSSIKLSSNCSVKVQGNLTSTSMYWRIIGVSR